MANDLPGLLQTSSANWDGARDVVNRLRVAHEHLALDAGDVVGQSSVLSDSKGEGAADKMHARSLQRSLAVWILIGSLWISVGMIVSAAIVTVAFLV